MNENAARMLDEFVRRAAEMSNKANTAKAGEAEKAQNELSLFIGQEARRLTEQGLTVTEIQNALRAATDRVPQTYAPDADVPGGDSGEKLEPPVSETACFLPVEEAVITAFSAGKLNKNDLAERVFDPENITYLEMTDGLDLVLTNFGKDPAMEGITSGGEVVAGSDGEAFMPEYLDVRNADDYQFSVCDPMVYKSAEEVRNIYGLLRRITEKEFFKKADIKKLSKAGWLDGYDKRSVKKEADYIKQELWKEFAALRDVYQRAAEGQKGIVIFPHYEGLGVSS